MTKLKSGMLGYGPWPSADPGSKVDPFLRLSAGSGYSTVTLAAPSSGCEIVSRQLTHTTEDLAGA